MPACRQVSPSFIQPLSLSDNEIVLAVYCCLLRPPRAAWAVLGTGRVRSRRLREWQDLAVLGQHTSPEREKERAERPRDLRHLQPRLWRMGGCAFITVGSILLGQENRTSSHHGLIFDGRHPSVSGGESEWGRGPGGGRPRWHRSGPPSPLGPCPPSPRHKPLPGLTLQHQSPVSPGHVSPNNIKVAYIGKA